MEHSKAHKKRLRSSEEENIVRGTEMPCVKILMYRADALMKLKQPLEALQCLNRILAALKGVFVSTSQSANRSEEIQKEQTRKRRKLESGAVFVSTEANQRCHQSELVKIKVQAYDKKALILEGLGQTHDALEQLHLALECFPDNPETVYHHSQLLLKLGSQRDAAHNWMRFRGVDISKHQEDMDTVGQSLGCGNEVFCGSDVTPAQVKEMDAVAMKC